MRNPNEYIIKHKTNEKAILEDIRNGDISWELVSYIENMTEHVNGTTSIYNDKVTRFNVYRLNNSMIAIESPAYGKYALDTQTDLAKIGKVKIHEIGIENASISYTDKNGNHLFDYKYKRDFNK